MGCLSEWWQPKNMVIVWDSGTRNIVKRPWSRDIDVWGVQRACMDGWRSYNIHLRRSQKEKGFCTERTQSAEQGRWPHTETFFSNIKGYQRKRGIFFYKLSKLKRILPKGKENQITTTFLYKAALGVVVQWTNMFKVSRKQPGNPEENCYIQDWSFLDSPGVSHTALPFLFALRKHLTWNKARSFHFGLRL